MASTYVNDLRLSEMATGDASGSWGTVTNTNLELIGEALGFGTEAITTNADAHTSTIADGSTDPIRAIFIKYTGTLDSACTITIGPNTVNKFCFIHNATSGSQSIIISQGSGANVTIATGQTKGVYLDGAGSGAAVVDAFATLSVVDLLVDDDLTVAGLATIGETLAVTGVLTTTAATVSNGGGQFNGAINVGVDDTGYDVKFFGDTASAFMLWDASADDLILGGAAGLSVNSAALVTGVLTTTAATVFNGGFAANDASTIIAADGASDNAYAFQIKNEEATDDRSFGLLIHAGSTATDRGLTINTHDGGAALFYVQGNGQALFTDGTAALPSITNNGDTNTGIFFPAADEIGFTEGGVEAARFDSSGRLLIGYTANTPVIAHGSALQVVGQGVSDYHGASINLVGFSNNANGAYLNFASGRSNSAGTFTIVANNDLLGNIAFAGADGTDFASYGVEISAHVDGAPGSNDMPGRLTFATTTDGGSSPTSRMTITSGGNVGIGTGVPATNYARVLHIATTGTGANLKLTDTSTGAGADDGFELITTGGAAYVWNRENTTLVFGTNDTERMRLSANGDLSIRITSAVAFSTTYAFFVKDGGAGCSVFKSTAGAGFSCINSWNAATSGTRYHLYFREGTDGTVRGSITSNGSATAYNTSSDYRLKENVDYNWDATTRLKQLKPARFNWIEDDTNTLIDGFLAHEAQAVVPECVTGTKDEVDDDGVAVMQAIDQSKLVPLLVKTIQELEARITALEA